MISFRLLIDRAEKGEDIELWGDPTRNKEILYVKDLAQLIQNCVESTLEGGINNVGGLKQVTREEQIDGIIEVFTNEKKSNKILRPDKPDALFNHLDISKTVKELGYSPKYSYIDWHKDFKKEMEEEEIRKTAKYLLILFYYVDPFHLESYLGNNNFSVVEKWTKEE